MATCHYKVRGGGGGGIKNADDVNFSLQNGEGNKEIDRKKRRREMYERTHRDSYAGFPTRMVYLYYIACLRYTILVGNPRYYGSVTAVKFNFQLNVD